MDNQAIVEMNKKYSLFSWSVQDKVNPLVIEGGSGIYVFDAQGNKYMDLSSQLVNANLGHQHPKVIEAIKKAADKLTFAAPSYANSSKGQCAKSIISLMPEGFGKVFFTNGGADANENAIKIARAYTKKHKIISRYRSYHGSTAGAIALTGDPRRWPTEPGMPGVIKCFDPYCYRCPFGKEPDKCQLECASHIEEIIMYENPEAIAAIIVETVVGTNGIIPPPPGYMEKLREICTKNNILLICDEVMAGWGRCGKMFAFENYNIVPDIITTAKGITSGYVPLGAVIVKSEIADYFNTNLLAAGLTYSGHTLAVSCAIEAIKVYREESLPQNAAQMGEYIIARLKEMQKKHPCIGDIRGKGLLIGIEIVKDPEARQPMASFNSSSEAMNAFNSFLKENMLLTMVHWNMIMFCPPLIINKKQIDEALEVFDKGFDLLDTYCV